MISRRHQLDPDSYDGAIAAARRDYARLFHQHSPVWQVDMECKRVVWSCTCDDLPRNSVAMESHILNSVRKERGPIRPPNTQTKRY